jgi:hypothetical protein
MSKREDPVSASTPSGYCSREADHSVGTVCLVRPTTQEEQSRIGIRNTAEILAVSEMSTGDRLSLRQAHNAASGFLMKDE